MNIAHILDVVKKDGIVFLTYGGFLSQSLLASMTETLEQETQNSGLNINNANNIFTVFIELSQNMMNYSKNKNMDEFTSEGLILAGKDNKNNYFIHSQNIVATKDKDKIEPILKHIKTLSLDEIKATYRKLRKSGKNTHGRGGGIGFYEIAKRCSFIDYQFDKIQKDRYYFHFKAEILTTNKEK